MPRISFFFIIYMEKSAILWRHEDISQLVPTLIGIVSTAVVLILIYLQQSILNQRRQFRTCDESNLRKQNLVVDCDG